MAKRLSRRPLKRIVRFEIQLGPYSVLYRDGKQRPREHYVIWTAELPRGKHHPRFIAVLQQMNRPAQYWDRVHNPVLFQKIVLLSGGHDADTQAKAALHQAQARMYWLLEKHLKKLSRTLIKWRWTTDVELPEAWETIDPPSESLFEQWHLETMHKLTSFLGNWKNWMEPFGYLGLLDKTEKLISD
jgi:hypothetical protein